MDIFDSESTVESIGLKEFESELTKDSFKNDTVSSPNISEDSVGDANSRNELDSNLNVSKNVALAKKRLQAYTNKTIKKVKVSKQDKIEESDKTDKNQVKKSKKGSYLL